MKRLFPLLGLLALAGCGDSGRTTTDGSSTATSTIETKAIVVQSPAAGKAVRSPIRVTGTANTFEATFMLELRTGGRLLARKTVRATSGSGVRGTFAATFRYSVPEETRGELRAYELSAKDGTRINTVTVPISLLP